MDSYAVELTKSAEKDLRRIDKRYLAKIFAVVESLQMEPRPVGCTKLAGSDHTYRVRVGTYRVIKVGHRKNVYQ